MSKKKCGGGKKGKPKLHKRVSKGEINRSARKAKQS